MSEKILYIIAGANGSGKSTLANELLPNDNLLFLNADDIAQSFCPLNIESAKITAGKVFFKNLNELFLNKKSFAIETTLAGNNHLKTIQRARELNYKINLIYSYIDNPKMCINRIHIRVLGGGHSVPEEDIIRRFYRSKINFWKKYKNLVDEWALFYNGTSEYILVAQSDNKNTTIFHENLYNEFIRDLK